ncbi:5'/3'-nucleotidase SurE [Pseudomonadota bacterium]|nr:5'/3'-nucleotidase SurE [Pseudomonadota bacterium]MDC0198556.1 5'/3'-nucleotidase SurE [Pseudomonadota bacterium]
MNILLTNDDGYKASGINELFEALSTEHKVFLIAPRENCSGMSAAISLRKEIKVEEISKNIFSVSGTPADCSYLGLLSVIPEPIEMIVSGINLGANLGEDIFYSGTVGAAIAGRRLNYVPVAFSVAAFNPKNLKFISEQSLLITNQISKLPADQNLLVNVNFPDLPTTEIEGTRITSLGKRGTPDTPDLIREKNSSKFYSFGPSGSLLPGQAGTDIQAIEQNYISISILDYNLSSDIARWDLYKEIFNCE